MMPHPPAAPATHVAVICLGYLGEPAGVLRLAGYFAAAQARMYVHIDARSDITGYRAALMGQHDVVLLDRRRAIHWGGFSLVHAVVDALEAARADAAARGMAFTRFCLLTEDSAPLVQASVFRRLMGEPEEFMHCYDGLGDDIRQRYDGFYAFDRPEMNPRSEPAARVVDSGLQPVLARIEALRNRRKAPLVQLFHGSTWWALSARAVETVLRSWHGDAHLRESFEFSMIPEEQYFQTILGNAAAAGNGEGFVFRPFIYTDFTREPRPYVYRGLEELTALRALPLLFARKVALDSAEATRFIGQLAV